MPDRGTPGPLDVRLARGRADLLDTIDQPPLHRIRDRAAARRRRRRTAGGAGALLAVALAATLVVRPWAGPAEPSPPPVAGTPPGGPVYASSGITINGLTGSGVAQVPGAINDVEFTDPDHGYLLAECPAAKPCPATVARTADGGLSWDAVELPADTRGRTGLDLIAFPDGRLLLAGDITYASPDQGRTWHRAVPEDPAPPVPPQGGDRLRLGSGPGRCGGTVEVWRPGWGRAGVTPGRPGIDVCWLGPVVATDGAWWAGGTRDGSATLAVTRDRGGSWQQIILDAPAPRVTSVEVAVLGSHAYAAVLGADRSLIALFHSTDGGRTFARVRSGGDTGPPDGLAGAIVPLLDGRVLVAGTDRRWYVSADDGRTFTRAEGNLPAVGRLARTPAGYVAYDLFGGGWAAYSSDGATWRKLQIN
jgi:hypothetical protein